MKNAELSIIVPVYNCEKELEKCVGSILAQNYKDFELILIDDGSSDSSGRMCDQLSDIDDRIVIIHQNNQGVSSARNVGIRNAHGELITFIDSDDYIIDNNYLSTLVSYSDYDYVVTGFTNVYIEDGTVKEMVKHVHAPTQGKRTEELPDDFFINGGFHPVWGKLYKKRYLIKNEIFFTNARISEDSLFNIDYIKCISSWTIIDCCSYGYVKNNQGMNATSRIEKNDIDVYDKLYTKMLEANISKSVVRKTIYPQYLALCYRCLNSSDLSNGSKREMIDYILNRPRVKKTLMLTCRNTHEWFRGVLICIFKK